MRILETAMGGARASVALIAVCLSGACVPQVEPFRFVELEPAPGLRLDLAGPLGQPEVWFAGDVPLRYLLERSRYRLLLINDPPSVPPGLTIALGPESEPGMQLVPAPRARRLSPDGKVCAAYKVLPAGIEMEFRWAADCSGERQAPRIAFNVVNEQGDLVAPERLRFALRRRGWHVLGSDLE